jgi:hypothetical protein
MGSRPKNEHHDGHPPDVDHGKAVKRKTQTLFDRICTRTVERIAESISAC